MFLEAINMNSMVWRDIVSLLYLWDYRVSKPSYKKTDHKLACNPNVWTEVFALIVNTRIEFVPQYRLFLLRNYLYYFINT